MNNQQDVISIENTRKKIGQPWLHRILGQVDDYCVYLCHFEGVYRFHRHDLDEMYLVLEGEIFIEFKEGPTLVLKAGDTLVVQAGQVHRSGSTENALVLMFKACDLFAE
ncbi:MAG: cupin domain-containing protein [Anaerolineales bacterium]|nr:cupin domain-containing protein [Anaerolineales bacterium]